jgi:preprotein translocase subunit YajC
MPRPDGLLLALDPAGGGSLVSTAVLMAFMGAIIYFIMLRPQQKEAKEQAQLLASLQKGDRVVTLGGVHARIQEVKGDTLVLELSPNVLMTIDRDAVKRKVDLTKVEPVKGA